MESGVFWLIFQTGRRTGAEEEKQFRLHECRWPTLFTVSLFHNTARVPFAALYISRPDCRSGNLRLGFRFKNSNAEIGVSEAHIFPQFALTGSGGRFFGRSSHFSSLIASHHGTWKSGATSPASQFTLMIE